MRLRDEGQLMAFEHDGLLAADGHRCATSTFWKISGGG